MSASAVRVFMLILLAMAVLSGAATSAAGGVGEPRVGRDDESAVTVLRSNSREIDVMFDLGAYVVRESEVGGVKVAVVEAQGLHPMQQPGLPDLPARGVLLGVPPSGDLELTVTYDAREDTVHTVRPSSDGRVIVDRPLDVGDGQYPGTLAELTDVAWFRGQRVARLEFHPFQLEAAEGADVTLRVIPRIRATIRLVGGGESDVRVLANPADPLADSILPGVLANFESARRWRVDGAAPPADAGFTSPLVRATTDPGYNVRVKQEGMYRVTGSDLNAAGVPIADLEPSSLSLWKSGRAVAIHVSADLEDRLEPHDWFAFYAEPEDHKYADDDVYQLYFETMGGRRMVRRSASPAMVEPASTFTDTARVESNDLYAPEKPHLLLGELDPPGVDRWYWRLMSAPASIIERIVLPGVAAGSADLTIGVTVVGKSDVPTADPDHTLVVSVNGVHAGETWWDGDNRRETLRYSAASVPVVEGSVDVRLIAPGRPGVEHDQFYVDRIEVGYPRRYRAQDGQLRFSAARAAAVLVDGFGSSAIRVYDVTDAMAPVLMTATEPLADVGNGFGVRFGVGDGSASRSFVAVEEGQYRTASAIEPIGDLDWRDADLGADLIVIRPSQLDGAAARLADHRAMNGARVVTADLHAIYDRFGFGVAHPAALRSYLAYAFANWQPPAPSAVLLFGDATYDPKLYLTDSRSTLLPTYLHAVDPWLGEVATDHPFATLSGGDRLPDLAVGRLPVADAAEADAVVDKILAYEGSPAPGDWRARMLFAADNPDSASNFHMQSDAIVRDLVPDAFAVEKVYLGRTHTDGPSAREAIVDSLDTGNLVTHYSGHGTSTTWAAEDILRRSDVLGLTNGGRLPVLLDMTCLTGYFVDPLADGISETAVLLPDGGAVGSFSPTGFGVATGHDVLDRAFLSALLEQEVGTLGAATLASKVHLYARFMHGGDLLDTFVLLGDPSLLVPVLDVPLPSETVGTPGPTPVSTPTTMSTPAATADTVTPAQPSATSTPTDAAHPAHSFLPLVRR